jgi:hypothetical protein
MIEARADFASFERVAAAIKEEEDGKQLRLDLIAGFRAALEPAVNEVRSALMAMGSGGLHAEPLREAVARQIKTQVRLSGRSAGVRIRAGKNGMPRGFRNAPKRINQRSWRHQIFGTDAWVTQVGAPGYFDDTVERGRSRYEAAAYRALDNVAERIGRKG